MAKLNILRESDIKVTIITNSLASTDVFLVYGGYKDYIKALVEMGVKPYEVKPYSSKKFFETKIWANHHSLSLHTKMIIFDNDRIGIGSANIDPRSDKLNTETFMIVSSEKLVKEQREILDEIINLENLYQLSWGKYPNGFDEDITNYGPIWHTLEEGKIKTYYSPPHAGFWKKIGTNLFSLLPIKGYL